MNSAPQPPRPLRQVLISTWWWLGPIILITLFYQVENWRGERYWQQEIQRLIAQGESIKIQDYLPKPLEVPDELNAAMAPLFSASPGSPTGEKIELLNLAVFSVILPDPTTGTPLNFHDILELLPVSEDIRRPTERLSDAQDTLLALTLFDSTLDQLQSAAERPYARFPVDWEDDFFDDRPFRWIFWRLGNLLVMRACARIADNQGDKALQDILLILRLADLVQGPALHCQYHKNRFISQAIHMAWFGIASHAWTETQLSHLLEILDHQNLNAHALTALRAERSLSLTTFKPKLYYAAQSQSMCCDVTLTQFAVMRSMPQGWLRQLQVHDSQEYERIRAELLKGMSPKGCLAIIPSASDDSASGTALSRWLSAFLSLDYRSYDIDVLRRTRRTMAEIALTKAAIALERHRLSQGSLPHTPSSPLPLDPVTGTPLHYHRIDHSRYKLWSVADNEIDDGGQKGSGEDWEPPLDWVWLSYIVDSPPSSEKR